MCTLVRHLRFVLSTQHFVPSAATSLCVRTESAKSLGPSALCQVLRMTRGVVRRECVQSATFVTARSTDTSLPARISLLVSWQLFTGLGGVIETTYDRLRSGAQGSLCDATPACCSVFVLQHVRRPSRARGRRPRKQLRGFSAALILATFVIRLAHSIAI